MSGWQPDDRPRHVAGQRPAVPPQFRDDAPPRQDGTRSAVRYGQPASPWPSQPPRPRFEPSGRRPRRSAPAYRAPAPQPRPAQRPAGRSLPPYPWHQVRFPWRALPRSRRGGPSLGRLFYLGRHPIAMLIQVCIVMIAFEVIVAWVALVAMFWAVQVICVTIAWLWQCRQARTAA